MDTISYEEVTRRITDAVAIARQNSPPDSILVAVIHPRVNEFIQPTGFRGDPEPELRGIRGCQYVMVSEDVKGFRVVVWTNEMTIFDRDVLPDKSGETYYRQTAADSVESIELD